MAKTKSKQKRKDTRALNNLDLSTEDIATTLRTLITLKRNISFLSKFPEIKKELDAWRNMSPIKLVTDSLAVGDFTLALEQIKTLTITPKLGSIQRWVSLVGNTPGQYLLISAIIAKADPKQINDPVFESPILEANETLKRFSPFDLCGVVRDSEDTVDVEHIQHVDFKEILVENHIPINIQTSTDPAIQWSNPATIEKHGTRILLMTSNTIYSRIIHALQRAFKD